MKAPLLLLAFLLAACGPPTDGERLELLAPGPEGVVAIGDGHPLQLVEGPQGGYHLDVGVRMFHFDPDGATLVYEAWAADRLLSADIAYALRSGRFQRVDGHWARTADRVILEIAQPSQVVGETVELVAVVELADGRRVAAARTVVIAD